MSYPVFYPIAGDTLIVPFDTFDGGTGASITMTGLAVTDIEIYADGSATQRASDNGYALLDTDGIDRDGITGIHGFSIDLSDNSDAGFYSVGPWYEVVVSAVTIDGQTVNFIAAMFRILSATRGMAGAALPDAAADAAGGLPISDAGGLDVDNRMLAAAAVTNLDTLYDGVEGFGPAYAGPRGPGVYLNDAAANTNTVNGTDGTWNNHVSTIAAAKTIADSLGVNRIYLVNNTVITLAATMEDYEFIGIGEMMANTIDLGSQDVDNSYFENVLISGAQGGTGRIQAEGCVLSVITGMEITARRCTLASGTLTLRNDCAFDLCTSAVAGGGTPILDINSVASVNVYFGHYSGGLQINNAVSTTVMSYQADGQIVIGATCTSLTIHVRGNCTITDNGTTTSLTQDAAVNRTNINAEVVDTLITDTYAEPAAVPAAAASIKDMIHWQFTLARNKGTQTNTTKTLRNDGDAADIATSAISDDGTTFTRGKYS